MDTYDPSPENAADAEKPLPSIRFDCVPYRPDGGCPSAGAALLVGLTIVGGLILGYVASFISQYFYLVLLFPIGIGIGLGMVGAFGISLGKVRNPLAGGIAGFVGGCVAMVGMHYFDYQRDLDAFVLENPKIDKTKLAAEGDFLKFVDNRAKNGVRIGRARGGNKDKGLNLGYYGSYAYWTIELLVVAGIAFFMMRGSAAEPFCTRCKNWKREQVLGGLSWPGFRVVEILESGEVSRLLENAPPGEAETLVVKVADCAQCGQDATVNVKLECMTKNSKGELEAKELVHYTYPGEALVVFQSIFAAQQQPPAADEGEKPAG